VALWARRIDQGTALEAVAMDAAGVARGPSVTLAQSAGQLVWADIVPTRAGGPIALWADQRGDRATVSAVRLEPNARPHAAPTTLASAVRAWQVASTPSGAALAYVQAQGADASGFVALQMIDANARPIGTPVVVSAGTTAQPDVDLAVVGEALVAAWTDRRDLDSRVYAASLDLRGALVAPPHALTPQRGEQAFVALVGPYDPASPRALVAFDDLSQRFGATRTLRLGSVDARAALGPRTVALEVAGVGREVPEIVAASDGFVALTQAAACRAVGPCDDRTLLPAFVRLDHDLGVVAGAPLLVDKLDGQTPSNAWALGCTRAACSALVAGFTSPAPLVSVSVPSRATAFRPAAWVEAPPSPPYLLESRVVTSLDKHLSEVAAARVADRTLLGWVTYFVEPPEAPRVRPPAPKAPPGASAAPAGGKPAAPAIPGDPNKPWAANLSVLSLEPSGKAAAEPTIVSVRALSAGGVAIAPGAPGAADAAVAWVARDAGDPQVFVTRLSSSAKREAQVMLTRAKGDAADTAIAWAGDGWIVAWIDWRDGNGEVYAAKVDRALRKIVPDTRLTQAPGDASDPSLLVRGAEVLVAYGDPRDHPSDGTADPFVQKLGAASLARVGAETRLDLTPLHSRSVRVAAAGDALVAGWLEQASLEAAGARAGSAGPRFVRLDPSTLAPLGSPAPCDWPAGWAATSFAFGCGADGCRGVVGVGTTESLQLGAVVWSIGRAASVVGPVAALLGPPASDISPSLVGDDVLFLDGGLGGEVRVRRARIAWARP
jgi:hypothetical protein